MRRLLNAFVGSWGRPVPPMSRWCCGCRVASVTEAIANSNQEPISRSKGTRRRIDRPSGFQSRLIWPPSCFTIACESTLPNPSLCGFPSRCGPPRSFHTITNSPFTVDQSTLTQPPARRSAPYLHAFVANSCNSSAKLVTALPVSCTSGPLAATEPPFFRSEKGAIIVCKRAWRVVARLMPLPASAISGKVRS